MSILLQCKRGLIPKEVKSVALQENLLPEDICKSVARGHVVITSAKRGIQPTGVGIGLRKKFGTIVGTSTAEPQINPLICKARVAQECGASAIHDGSAAGDIDAIHKTLLQEINIPIGFCHPVRVAALCEYQGRNFLDVDSEEFISILEEDAGSGCEIILGPFAVTMDLVNKLSCSNRLIPAPNKTGSLMIAWMRHNNAENPYVEHFNRVLEVARNNNVVLSFVNGLRSGCIADAVDELQIEEIQLMGTLIQKAHNSGVQVKAGGGGHVPLDKIPSLFSFEKKHVNVPIISFGPQVTDISLAYDHVTAAIGQSLALMSGADMILTITSAEHLALPNVEEVKESCIIAHYVCHSVDLANGKDLDKDIELSKARSQLDWKTQFASAKNCLPAERIHRRNETKPGCSMCGDSCALLLMNQPDREVLEKMRVKACF